MTDQTPSISIPLFPVPICLYNYGKDNHELNLSLISDISKEVENDPVGETRSNFGGWHSYDAVSYTHLTLPTK